MGILPSKPTWSLAGFVRNGNEQSRLSLSMDETARVNDRDPRFANFSKSHKVVIPKKSCIWRRDQ